MFRVWACFTTPATMRQIMARQNPQLDGDDRHFKEMEKAPYTGLWWPDSHAFKVLFDTTAETCERYEAGEIDGDKAADIVFEAIRDCESINALGWKGPEDLRFFRATTTMMKFMWWASTSGPQGDARPRPLDAGRRRQAGGARPQGVLTSAPSRRPRLEGPASRARLPGPPSQSHFPRFRRRAHLPPWARRRPLLLPLRLPH